MDSLTNKTRLAVKKKKLTRKQNESKREKKTE